MSERTGDPPRRQPPFRFHRLARLPRTPERKADPLRPLPTPRRRLTPEPKADPQQRPPPPRPPLILEPTSHPPRRQPPLGPLDRSVLDRWINTPPTRPRLKPEPLAPPLMPEPTGDPRRPPPSPPLMVLVDRRVRWVNELQELIKETGGLTLRESIESALKRLPAVKHLPGCSSSSSSSIDREAQEQKAIREETKRYRAEVEGPAFALLRERKASHPSAVRKEPLPEGMDDGTVTFGYRALLDGVEPCFSPPVAEAPPSVTCLSLKFAWPSTCHLLIGPRCPASIESCHHCLLVLYVGIYRPWVPEPGFYLVYNALANSLAIVPQLFMNYKCHCPIGPAAVLCCSIVEGEYVLAELFLCRDVKSLLPINKATFFIWTSSSSEWVKKEVVLPLPTVAAAAADDKKDTASGTCSFHEDMVWVSSSPDWVEKEVVLPLPTVAAADDDEKDTTTGTCSFHADMVWASSSPDWVEKEVVLPLPTAAADEKDTTTGIGTCSFHADMAFGVSFSSICWVDLITGILVYNHIPSEQFHFIPLPEECVTTLVRNEGQLQPDACRSMCCVDRQTLKFVAMDESCSQECPMLTMWTLRRPLSPTNWKWEKDAVSSFCIKDLWEDQVYKDMLLRPLWPRFPVISAQEPGIIYLSATDCEDNESHYVLSLNMVRCRIESVYKVPSDKDSFAPAPSLFTSDFSRYLNKTREWELMHGARDKKIADEVQSRSSLDVVEFGIFKPSRCVIPTLGGPSSRKIGPLASSVYPITPMGLYAALDIPIS